MTTQVRRGGALGGAAMLVALLAGCLGPDLVDSAADKARDFAWQLAVAVGDQRDLGSGSDQESRFGALREIFDGAAIQNAVVELTGAARDGNICTYEIAIDAAAERGGGSFSEEAAVRMCVRYVVDLTDGTPVEPERARCEGEAAEMPARYVEVQF